MGDWAVAMPDRAGEKKTTYSQTLAVLFLPSINISVHLRTGEVILAAEDGCSITYSTGKWFKRYINAKLRTDIWTMDKCSV